MRRLTTGLLVLFVLSLGLVLPAADFNGDGKDDIAIFREATGLWAVRGVTRVYFGQKLDIPIPGDYGGGSADEIAIFRPDSGLWAVRGVTRAYFGSDGDIPLGQSGLKQSGNFFYDPAKWAFRAGRVTGNQWDDQNIGAYSTAVGLDTTASNLYSIATGWDTTASGESSTAMGSLIEVSGNYSFGYGTNQSVGVDVFDSRVFVIHGAKVGIGTTTPSAALDVVDNRTAYVAEFINDGNNSNRSGIYIQCGSDTGIGSSFLAGFFDGDGDPVGGISFSGGTVTYGTFTADHEAAIPEEKNGEGYPYGTVMSLQAVRSNPERPRQVDYRVEPSRKAYDKAVFGVYAGKHENKENTHTIYALGDGQILVTGEGGDIEAGDYLTTSNKEGYAMKQDDDFLHSYSVAKALENVDWEREGSTAKLIACTYHAQ